MYVTCVRLPQQPVRISGGYVNPVKGRRHGEACMHRPMSSRRLPTYPRGAPALSAWRASHKLETHPLRMWRGMTGSDATRRSRSSHEGCGPDQKTGDHVPHSKPVRRSKSPGRAPPAGDRVAREYERGRDAPFSPETPETADPRSPAVTEVRRRAESGDARERRHPRGKDGKVARDGQPPTGRHAPR